MISMKYIFMNQKNHIIVIAILFANSGLLEGSLFSHLPYLSTETSPTDILNFYITDFNKIGNSG